MITIINRESVVKGLWVLQKRGLIEYSLSVPAMYVTLNTRACWNDFQSSKARKDSDERNMDTFDRESCGNYNHAMTRNNAVSVYLDSNSGNNNNNNNYNSENKENNGFDKIKDKSSDMNREEERHRESVNEWMWCLSQRVCAVLNRIDDGVSRRSGDMWRLGNVISSCCSRTQDSVITGNESELLYEGADPGSNVESAQEGVSSFLCHYLETLSGRSPSYQSTSSFTDDLECKVQVPRITDNVAARGAKRKDIRDENKIQAIQDNEENDGNDRDKDRCSILDEDNNENLSSIKTWERMFFLVPSPIQDLDLNTESSPLPYSTYSTSTFTSSTSSASSAPSSSTSSFTSSTSQAGDVDDAGGLSQNAVTEILAEGNEHNEIANKGEKEKEIGTVMRVVDGGEGGGLAVDCEMNHDSDNINNENEECHSEVMVSRSEIRKLNRDIIALSMDTRLLHIMNRITNPVVAAFSPPSHPLSRQSATSARIKQSKQRKLNLNGRLSWKQAAPGSTVDSDKFSYPTTLTKGKEKRASLTEVGTGTGTGIGSGTLTGTETGIGSGTLTGTETGIGTEEKLGEGRGTGSDVNTDATKDFVPEGERELLALLITRVLHGLPTKLLTAAAWRDHSASWGQYRGFTFLSVLNAVKKILPPTAPK